MKKVAGVYLACFLMAFLLPWLVDGSTVKEASCASQDRDEPVLIDAPYIDQTDQWPTGCESVSAVMALQYSGVQIGVDEFIDGYLPQGNAPYWEGDAMWGCDPRKAFPGDPRSQEGWGCYASVIVSSVGQALTDHPQPSLDVFDCTGESLESLCGEYLDRRIPVILWATIGMAQPQESTVFYLEDTGEPFTWIYPLHCLLLVGYDSDRYFFNDPMEGKAVAYEKESVERAYQGLGKQAVVIVPRRSVGNGHERGGFSSRLSREIR